MSDFSDFNDLDSFNPNNFFISQKLNSVLEIQNAQLEYPNLNKNKLFNNLKKAIHLKQNQG